MNTSLPELRPMDLGDILDKSFRLYRRHLRPLLTIAAIVGIPSLLLQGLALIPYFNALMPLLDPEQVQNNNRLFEDGGQAFLISFLPALCLLLGASVVGSFAAVIQAGAMVSACSNAILNKPFAVREMYRQSLARWRPQFGLIGLGVMVAIPAIILAIIPCIGALTLFVLAILGGVRLMFTEHTIMLEQKGAIDSLKRSWALTRDSFWRIFGILLVVGLMLVIISAVPTYAAQISGMLLLPQQPLVTSVLVTLVSGTVSILISAFTIMAYTHLYYDMRVRKEGLDLQLAMDRLAHADTTNPDQSGPTEPSAE